MAGHYINTVEDQRTGRPVNGATVLVYNDGASISGNEVTTGTLATIFSDDGITTIDQTNAPIVTASNGFFDFYTNETRVVVAVLFNGEGTEVYNDVDILGGTVSSDVTALSVRVDAVEAVTQDPLIVDLAGLVDPDADRIVFWDDSAGGLDWLTVGSGLSLSGTTLTASGLAGTGDITASGLTMSTNRILGRTTASTGAVEEISVGTGLTLSSGSLTAGLTQAVTVAQSGTPVATSVGYLGSPQFADQDDYTLTINDAGGHYYHVSGTPHTLTIPANASVAFPIGTVIAIVNENGAGNITLAITSDTLRWTNQTGSRTIAANGTCTLIKVTSTVWRLTGDGIT